MPNEMSPDIPDELWMFWCVCDGEGSWFASSGPEFPSTDGAESAWSFYCVESEQDAIMLAAELNRTSLESPDYCYPVRVK